MPQRAQRTTCVRLGAIVWMTMLCGAAWAAELGNVAPEFSAAGRADNPEVKAAKERFFKWGWGCSSTTGSIPRRTRANG